MTPAQYETALLALRAYQCAKSDSIDECLAVASVFRNRVLRLGMTYTEVLEAAESEISRGWPAINHPLLTDPQNGLLAVVSDIYREVAPDYTANHLHKSGAMYFMRVQDHQNTGDWWDLNILQKQEEHGLIGSWGAMQFFE